MNFNKIKNSKSPVRHVPTTPKKGFNNCCIGVVGLDWAGECIGKCPPIILQWLYHVLGGMHVCLVQPLPYPVNVCLCLFIFFSNLNQTHISQVRYEVGTPI